MKEKTEGTNNKLLLKEELKVSISIIIKNANDPPAPVKVTNHQTE
jgi:hypothetical protein